MEDQTRLIWADATRGVGVLAVVLFHVLIWHHDLAFGGEAAAAGIWKPVDSLLSSARMPMLLAVAGIFASRGLLGGFKTGKAQQRFVSNYYLYVVWLAVYFAVFLVLHRPELPHAIDSLQQAVLELLIPGTTLWFLFALAVYAVVVAVGATLRVPVPMMLVLGAGSWVVGAYAPLPEMAAKVPASMIFFFLGVYAAGPLRSLAVSKVRTRLLWVLPFLAASVVKLSPIEGVVDDVVGLIASVLAIPASIALVAVMCGLRSFARAAQYLGSRTLPIYVLHAPLLLVWMSVVDTGPWVSAMGSMAVDLAYPLVLSALIVAACLGLHRLLVLIPGDPLFTAPRALVTAAGKHERPTRR